MARKIWNAGDQVTAVDLNGNFKFGGTGSDGALSISSGTTTLSAGSAAYLETQKQFYAPLKELAEKHKASFVDQYAITRAATDKMEVDDPMAKKAVPYYDGFHTSPPGVSPAPYQRFRSISPDPRSRWPAREMIRRRPVKPAPSRTARCRRLSPMPAVSPPRNRKSHHSCWE